MPTQIELVQGSEAWHKVRNRSVGSSDCPTVLWLDPWGKSPFRLWMEKTGRAEQSNYDPFGSKKHGVTTEDYARQKAAQLLADFYAPTVVVADDPTWMIASLDGANHDLSEIMEVKCPQDIGTHLQAREGHIADNYYAQVQHQLIVTKAKVCHFFSWFKCQTCKGKNSDKCDVCKGLAGDGVMVRVEPDTAYQDLIIAAERQFWTWVEADRFPFPEGEAVVTDQEALTLACDLAATKAQLRIYEDRERQLKSRLMPYLFGAATVRCGPLEAQWSHKGEYTEKKPRSVAESLSCVIRRVDG